MKKPTEPDDGQLNRVGLELDFYKKLATKLGKEKSRTEAIIEASREALAAVRPLRGLRAKDPKGPFSPEHVLILLSDAQAGTEVIGRELGNEAWNYNTDIFRYRLRLYLAGILEVVTRHRKAYGVPHAHVWLGGDLIEGDTIFPSQMAFIDSNVLSQFFMIQYEVTAFLMELARRFEKVSVFTTVGNHGRVSSPKLNNDFVNWEFILYRNIQWLLRGHGNVQMDVPVEWWQIREINGHNFCFIHGEDIMRWSGFPWYGQARVVQSYTAFGQNQGTPFRYFVHGHHHQSLDLSIPIGETFANGSFVGFTRYTTKRLNMAGIRPAQTVLFVHPKVGVTARYRIHLDGDNPSLWEETMATRKDTKIPLGIEEFEELLKK